MERFKSYLSSKQIILEKKFGYLMDFTALPKPVIKRVYLRSIGICDMRMLSKEEDKFWQAESVINHITRSGMRAFFSRNWLSRK